jgi:hypothetical protein
MNSRHGRCQYQILADANFIDRIDQEIVRYLVHGSHSLSPPLCSPRGVRCISLPIAGYDRK